MTRPRNNKPASTHDCPADHWPFLDDRSSAVITLKRIVRGSTTVTVVHHDEDGGWQFLDGDDVTTDDAAVVGLGWIVEFDPTLFETATLPRGWYASRVQPDGPWWVAPIGVSIQVAYGIDKPSTERAEYEEELS
ncbi:MAG: hypothetical protein KJZ54_06650 [Phycisphaerales bacterium]|nr:hypothetical protein [Phycisphaerales bacterium]